MYRAPTAKFYPLAIRTSHRPVVTFRDNLENRFTSRGLNRTGRHSSCRWQLFPGVLTSKMPEHMENCENKPCLGRIFQILREKDFFCDYSLTTASICSELRVQTMYCRDTCKVTQENIV